MGVPGLWDVLRPAGKPRSLTHLAVVDGFEANLHGKRALRIGIDASIWFYHANYGKEGENPELRTLFFRCTRLMTVPFLPLFIFDGPKRPDIKRGKRVSGKSHWMVQGMQEIISAFGFEWRMAPGEAEAELAYLNRIGVVDAVLTDDVDTFLFGAKMLIRNASINLSGNRAHSLKNTAGKDDGNHVMTYRYEDITGHPDIGLTHDGLILIGVLRGGDYSSGLDGCGIQLARGLAKCGFGESLVRAARTLSRAQLTAFLSTWREELRHELRTNSQGHLPRKSPALAKSIPADFPDIDVVLCYTTPATSEAKGPTARNAVVNWDKEPDLGKIAHLCEMYFEWGVREIIIKRFRTVLWPSAVQRILRRSALLLDRRAARLAGVPGTPRKKPGNEAPKPVGTPSTMIARHFSSLTLGSPQKSGLFESEDESSDSEPLIVKIHSQRTHASTDGVLEYRLEIAPAQLVRLCEAGVQGLRTALPPELTDEEDEEDGEGKKKGLKAPPPHPDSHLRIWLPACMVKAAEPELVDEYEGIQQMKDAKKAKKAGGNKVTGGPKTASAATAAKAKPTTKATAALREEEEESSDGSSDHPSQAPAKAPRAKPVSATTSAGPNKPPSAVAKPSRPPQKRATTSQASKARPPRQMGASEESSDVIDPALAADLADPPPLSRLPSLTYSSRTSSSRTTSSSSVTGSRILTLLDGASSSAASTSQRPAAPAPKTKPAPRPFPISFDDFRFHDDDTALSHAADDPFASGTTSSPSSPQRKARLRSSLSSDSDLDSRFSAGPSHSALPKSPRRSPKQLSPRHPARHVHKKDKGSSSESDRSPSPSPLRRKAFTPQNKARPALAQEKEESDRAPSPSPSRPRRLAQASGATSTLPADLSVISIPSDSDCEPTPHKIFPLQIAQARLPYTAAKPRRANMKPTAKCLTDSSKSNAARRLPPRKIYDTKDIIEISD